MGRIESKEPLTDQKLRFMITENGFSVEHRGETEKEVVQYWYNRFVKDKYKALYDLGFQERPDWLDAAGSFLYLVSDTFQTYLLRQPDLQLLRDGTMFPVDEDLTERLLRSVPFSPGSEYIDPDWIAFVATCSTKTKAGKLAHKPLQYV